MSFSLALVNASAKRIVKRLIWAYSQKLKCVIPRVYYSGAVGLIPPTCSYGISLMR